MRVDLLLLLVGVSAARSAAPQSPHDLERLQSEATTGAGRPTARRPSRVGGVNITWAEFTDAHCTVPLGTPAPSLQPLGDCGVVPQTDPNKMWCGSSFRFNKCTADRGGPAVASYSAFSDGKCTKWFTNWTLSVGTLDCVKVPPGPNTTAHDPPIWHSVVAISCVDLPPV